MSEGEIAEIRGIASNQNLDAGVYQILEEKLKEFPDGELYKKRVSDMRRLTEINARNTNEEKLTTDDLRFIYEFDSKINGFGYEEDSRIKEIINNRNIKADLALITNYSEKQISLTNSEALRGGIKLHYGSLNLASLQSADGLTLPETINGSLNLTSLQSADGLTLPETINGSLNLASLRSADGLTLPETINGGLYLYGLRSADGLTLPKTINGSLYLGCLRSAEGLMLPEKINGDLNLASLRSVEGLTLPKTINGDLYLASLRSAEGLMLPETLIGNLNLTNLEPTEKDNLRKKYLNLKII